MCSDRATSRSSRGFTLVEMMVAVAIIVLVLGMTMAMFDNLRGTRSVDAGQNLLAAKLQRARALAIGLQEQRGVLIYEDPRTRAMAMTIIKVTLAKAPTLSGTATTAPEVIVDVDYENDDIEFLPDGVGAAFLSPGLGASTSAIQGYRPYGTVMFDALGRIDSVRCYSLKANESELARRYREIPKNAAIASHAAVMLYEQKGLRDLPASTNSLLFSAEQIAWLNQNCRAVVVNRYNGTLIKAD